MVPLQFKKKKSCSKKSRCSVYALLYNYTCNEYENRNTCFLWHIDTRPYSISCNDLTKTWKVDWSCGISFLLLSGVVFIQPLFLGGLLLITFDLVISLCFIILFLTKRRSFYYKNSFLRIESILNIFLWFRWKLAIGQALISNGVGPWLKC